MKFLTKKNYIIFCLFIALFFEPKLFSGVSQANYKSKDISNYFSGIISTNQYYNRNAYEYLNRVRSINSIHSQFNIEFIRTLILLEKFKQADNFSKKVWKKEELFFEADLLLGLNFLIKEDYEMAAKHFKRTLEFEYNFLNAKELYENNKYANNMQLLIFPFQLNDVPLKYHQELYNATSMLETSIYENQFFANSINIIDYVADLSLATPSHAAKEVVPERKELLLRI